MPLIFSRDALRQLDTRAVEQYHIPILVLMENAGRAVADAARARLKRTDKVLVLAGPGNNGGDGLVAARHLNNAGVAVHILLLAGRDTFKDAAATQLAIVEAMRLPLETISAGHEELRDWLVESSPADLLIDALFGSGLTRPVAGLAAEVIGTVNDSKHPILAVDIPSGLDCDTGEPWREEGASEGVAIQAAETVSFCGMKKGFGKGNVHTGRVTVAEIGIPLELLLELGEVK